MGDSDTGRTWKTDYVGLATIAFLQYGTTYMVLILGCVLVAR